MLTKAMMRLFPPAARARVARESVPIVTGPMSLATHGRQLSTNGTETDRSVLRSMLYLWGRRSFHGFGKRQIK